VAFELSPEMVALLGIFLGLLARSLIPFLRKIEKEGQDLKWDNKYTALLVIAAIITILSFPAFRAITNMTLSDPYALFVSAFIYGFFVDAAAIEGFEWLRPGKTETKTETETTKPSSSTPT